MSAIEIMNLTKNFGDVVAVNNIQLSIKEGEVFGFLGPNGAGKTTMVKLLNGMLEPTSGSATVLSYDTKEQSIAIHANAGVLTEHAMMYDQMSAVENLIFYGQVFGLSKEESEKRALGLLKQLDLLHAKDQKLQTYSTGMRQRLSLARAMIHKPKILFLDEPTSGLDPESAKQVNSIIKQLAKEEQTTIFLCTHQLRYAQEICSSYGLIDKGKLLASGDIESLRKLVYGGYKLKIKSTYYPKELAFTPAEDGMMELDVDDEKTIASLIKKIVEAGGDITHVSSRKLSLEEIYFALIGGDNDEQ